MGCDVTIACEFVVREPLLFLGLTPENEVAAM
jgi:hypothetical protein